MATEISGSVLMGVAEKLDTLDLTDEERMALAVVLAAGIQAGRQEPEVQGFMPTAVESPSLVVNPNAPFGSQVVQYATNGLQEPTSGYRVKVTYPWISGGATNTDDWAARG